MLPKGKKRKKKGLWIALALVLVAAGGGALWYFFGGSQAEPVFVYPFSYLGMTEYWGDTRESYGPVTSDKIQTVFVSETQTITEILVQQGDEVKEGDLLLRYDTTLSDLALERQRLEVEKLKLQLENAKKELQRIRNMRPMQLPPADNGADDEARGRLIDGSREFPLNRDYDGSSNERAMIVWISGGVSLSSSELEAIFAEAWANATELQSQNRPSEPDSGTTAELIPPNSDGSKPSPGGSEGGSGGGSGGGSEGGSGGGSEGGSGGGSEGGSGDPPSDPSEDSQEPVNVTSFYIVIRVTQNNRLLGQKLTWQGMRVSLNADGGFSFQFCTPAVPDYLLEESGDDPDVPNFDYGSGYTSSQLAQMRAQQEEKIHDLEFQIRMAEVDYQLMLLEASDGNVYAQVDGVIISLLDPEEARMTGQPMLKLSGGGGFLVEGTVSELEKDLLEPGQEVTINDWNTGMTYVGTVHSIGEFPSQQGYYNGMGNPNTSYYPFHVFVDSSADLQEGRYVSIMYASGDAESGIYLENPFIRTENGRSYVMVQGEDGLLEQRFVTTGKALWGSYTEILDGLTAEDLIAFPYGKEVKPGAPTQEGDRSDLYS